MALTHRRISPMVKLQNEKAPFLRPSLILSVCVSKRRRQYDQ
jgi:hypothetical protein